MASLRDRLFGPAAQSPPAQVTSRVSVENGGDVPLLAIFEPWCYTCEIAPGSEYVFEATSPRPGWLRVEPSADALTVYAWDACVARVLNAEGQVLETLDIRVPDFVALAEEARRQAP